MDNKQKCLCMIAILIAFMSFAYATSITTSSTNTTNQTLGLNIVVNNTNLAPNTTESFGTGERIQGNTYFNNNTDIELFVWGHAQNISQTAELHLFINGSKVADTSGRSLGSAEQSNKTIVAIIPRYSSYKIEAINAHHYEWREYLILSGNATVNNTAYLPLSGGTMSGDINMNDHNITNPRLVTAEVIGENISIEFNKTDSLINFYSEHMSISNRVYFAYFENYFEKKIKNEALNPSSPVCTDADKYLISCNNISMTGTLNMNNNNITSVNTITINNGITMQSTGNFYYTESILSNGTRPYVLSINLSNSSGSNNASNIFCNGHCNSDFSDIRFVLNNTTILPYWIENTTSGKVWVNVTSNGSVRMYYGNATDTNLSNGTNTFLQFTDSKTSSYILPLIIPAGSQYVYETSIKRTSAGGSDSIRVGVGEEYTMDTTKDSTRFISHSPSNNIFLDSYNNGALTRETSSPAFSQNIYYRVKIIKTAEPRVLGYVNNVATGTGITTNIPDATMGMALDINTGTATQDWAFVRKYVSPEQNFGTFGSEVPVSSSTTWCIRVSTSGALYTTAGNC